MHVVAATFMVMRQMHRLQHSIREEVDGTEVFYMYFRQQELIYKEILGDDFQVSLQCLQTAKIILIGGRNEVIRYSF
jgi:hypothetical protein